MPAKDYTPPPMTGPARLTPMQLRLLVEVWKAGLAEGYLVPDINEEKRAYSLRQLGYVEASRHEFRRLFITDAGEARLLDPASL